MGSLVLDIQRGALDSNVRLSDLLRRALVVARKLHLEDLEAWVLHELEGYPVGTEPPAYRVFEGEPRVWNPLQGWQPVVFANTAQQSAFCRQPTRQAVAEIEALVARAQSEGGRLSSNFPPEIARQLMGASGAPTPPVLQIDASMLIGLLDGVRSTLLKWSLKLQEDGIVGNDVEFSDAEKAIAAALPHTINNFFAPITGAQVQLASPGSTQVHHAGVDISALQQLLEEIEGNRDLLQLDADSRDALEADLRTLHAQLASPRPRSPILKEALVSIRAILEGAAGGTLGTAATNLLAKIAPLLQ